MKTCTTCKIAKDVDSFYKSKHTKKDGGISLYTAPSCKECAIKKAQQNYFSKHEEKKKYHREHYRGASLRYRHSLRAWVDEIKAGPCVDCGGVFPAVCMDFDHRDRLSKKDGVSNLINHRVSRARIEEEIAKCDLVCSNCHRVRTARQLGWKKGTTLI